MPFGVRRVALGARGPRSAVRALIRTNLTAHHWQNMADRMDAGRIDCGTVEWRGDSLIIIRKQSLRSPTFIAYIQYLAVAQCILGVRTFVGVFKRETHTAKKSGRLNRTVGQGTIVYVLILQVSRMFCP